MSHNPPKLTTVPQDSRPALAAELRAERERKGWTQERAAEETGVSVRHIRRIEGGRVRMTVLEYAEKLRRAA